VYLLAEPAPYSCPPIDLFDRELYFVSSTAHVPRREGAVLAALEEPIQLKVGDIALPRRVGRAGFFERAPISWASRSFVLIPLPPAASRPSVGD
jgi:hypothetical protein